MSAPLHAHDRLPPIPPPDETPRLSDLVRDLAARLRRVAGGRRHGTKMTINDKVAKRAISEKKEQKVN